MDRLEVAAANNGGSRQNLSLAGNILQIWTAWRLHPPIIEEFGLPVGEEVLRSRNKVQF